MKLLYELMCSNTMLRKCNWKKIIIDYINDLHYRQMPQISLKFWNILNVREIRNKFLFNFSYVKCINAPVFFNECSDIAAFREKVTFWIKAKCLRFFTFRTCNFLVAFFLFKYLTILKRMLKIFFSQHVSNNIILI